MLTSLFSRTVLITLKIFSLGGHRHLYNGLHCLNCGLFLPFNPRIYEVTLKEILDDSAPGIWGPHIWCILGQTQYCGQAGLCPLVNKSYQSFTWMYVTLMYCTSIIGGKKSNKVYEWYMLCNICGNLLLN